MRTLIWSNTFVKAFKKLMHKRPDQCKEVEKTLRLLVQDPFTPQLETHKLKGKLSGHGPVVFAMTYVLYLIL